MNGIINSFSFQVLPTRKTCTSVTLESVDISPQSLESVLRRK